MQVAVAGTADGSGMVIGHENTEQCSDLEVVLERVPKREIDMDLVVVAAPHTLVRDVPRLFELGDDALS